MRKPLHDCPLCSGKGEIQWHLYNDVGGREWMPVGSKVNPETGKKALRWAETPQSKKRRECWLETGAPSFKGSCPCTFWPQDHGFRRRLWRAAAFMVRVKRNEPIKESDLNDDLKDI